MHLGAWRVSSKVGGEGLQGWSRAQVNLAWRRVGVQLKKFPEHTSSHGEAFMDKRGHRTWRGQSLLAAGALEVPYLSALVYREGTSVKKASSEKSMNSPSNYQRIEVLLQSH